MPNILVVDDSAFARSNMRRMQSEAGYQITEAASGELALESARAQAPDLVTLDLLMPGMSGLEVLRALRVICPQTRVVIISADIQTATRQELLDAGAQAFFNKPAPRSDLLETVAQLTGQA